MCERSETNTRQVRDDVAGHQLRVRATEDVAHAHINLRRSQRPLQARVREAMAWNRPVDRMANTGPTQFPDTRTRHGAPGEVESAAAAPMYLDVLNTRSPFKTMGAPPSSGIATRLRYRNS